MTRRGCLGVVLALLVTASCWAQGWHYDGVDDGHSYAGQLHTYPFSVLVIAQLDEVADEYLYVQSSNVVVNDWYDLNIVSGALYVGVRRVSAAWAISVNTVAAGEHLRAIGVFESATSRISVLNGDWANRGTSSTNLTPDTCNVSTIGRLDVSSGDVFTHGTISAVVMWSRALSQGECQSLGSGADPLSVPGALPVEFLVPDPTLKWRNLVGASVTWSDAGAPAIQDGSPGVRGHQPQQSFLCPQRPVFLGREPRGGLRGYAA